MDCNYSNIFARLRAPKTTERPETPYQIKAGVEQIKGRSLLSINKKTLRNWRNLKWVSPALDVNDQEHLAVITNRDRFGEQTEQNGPVVTGNEAAQLKEYLPSLVIIAFFVLAESALYVIVTPLFLPGLKDYLKFPVALFLALLGMMGLATAYSRHFHHQELLGREGVPASELRKSLHKCLWGYLLGLLTLVSIVASGLARIHFCELTPAGLSPDRLHSLILAGKATSVFTMAVTLSAAMLMATVKYDAAAMGISFHVHRAWRRVAARRSRLNRKAAKNAVALLSTIERSAERSWLKVVALKEKLSLKDEFDGKYAALHEEYVTLKAAPGFALNDGLYLKFAPLQSSCEALYKYGIVQAPEIREKVELAKTVLSRVNTKDASPQDSGNAVQHPQGDQSAPPQDHKPSNGAINNGLALFISAAFLTAGMTSCTSPHQPVNLIGLADLSASRDSNVISWYTDAIGDKLFPLLGQTDRIAFLPIDNASATFSDEIYAADFGKNTYQNEMAGLQSDALAEKSHRDSLKANAGRFRVALYGTLATRKKFAQGTDIIGALKNAARYRVEGYTNFLVLFSDMVQETGPYSVNLAKETFTAADYPSLVGRMEKSDLTGMKVFVITGDQGRIAPEKFELVRGLWDAYIRRSGGELVEYSSGFSTTLEKAITQN